MLEGFSVFLGQKFKEKSALCQKFCVTEGNIMFGPVLLPHQEILPNQSRGNEDIGTNLEDGIGL
jgi:hypothetical protein